MGLLSSYFAEQGPGAALAVVVDGQAPRIECVGCSEVEEKVAISAHTVFDLASASKPFTAALVVLLAERGQLDLQAPAREYLPELMGSQGSRPVLVRDLLWHTSGLTDYLELGAHTPVEQMTRAYLLEQLPGWASVAFPGREHRYSNTNYFVLARIAEAVSGLPFTELLEELLFKPFGLSSTALRCDVESGITTAIGYQVFGYGLPEVERCAGLVLDTDGDGGIVSSLSDLVRWQALLWGCEILNEASLRCMQTPGALDSGEKIPYGMGLQVEGHGQDTTWCGHGGSWMSSTTMIGRYVHQKTTVIVLSNELMAPVERISQRAFAEVHATGSR